MKGLFQKHYANLVPADEAAEKIVRRVKNGTNVWADVTVPKDQRSAQHHRLYFALLKKVFENLPERFQAEIPSLDVLRWRLAYTIGFTEVIHTGAGPKEIPRSVAFDKLGQSEFYEKVWIPTVNAIVTKIIPGLEIADLEREVHQMIGGAQSREAVISDTPAAQAAATELPRGAVEWAEWRDAVRAAIVSKKTTDDLDWYLESLKDVLAGASVQTAAAISNAYAARRSELERVREPEGAR